MFSRRRSVTGSTSACGAAGAGSTPAVATKTKVGIFIIDTEGRFNKQWERADMMQQELLAISHEVFSEPRRTSSGKKTAVADVEDKLKKQYPNNPGAVYGTLNKIGLKEGSKTTAKGKRAAKKK